VTDCEGQEVRVGDLSVASQALRCDVLVPGKVDIVGPEHVAG